MNSWRGTLTLNLDKKPKGRGCARSNLKFCNRGSMNPLVSPCIELYVPSSNISYNCRCSHNTSSKYVIHSQLLYYGYLCLIPVSSVFLIKVTYGSAM